MSSIVTVSLGFEKDRSESREKFQILKVLHLTERLIQTLTADDMFSKMCYEGRESRDITVKLSQSACITCKADEMSLTAFSIFKGVFISRNSQFNFFHITY